MKNKIIRLTENDIQNLVQKIIKESYSDQELLLQVDNISEMLGHEDMVGAFSDRKNDFIKGYTQCQEDMGDKKYTEDDLREAIDMARMLSHVSCLEDGEHRLKYSNTEEDIIKSLNKQD